METLKILVLSNIEWSDENAFGNTMSNLLGSMPKVDIACLYRRNARPNNNVCKKYYQISYTSIIKNCFRTKKIGTYFEIDDSMSKSVNNIEEKEGKLIGLIHRWKLTRLVYRVEDFLFKRKTWENDNFKRFIYEFQPNIVMGFTSALLMDRLLIESILNLAPACKYVTFITDDLYGVNKAKKVKETIKKQILLAHKIYAITPGLKEKYEQIYGVKIDILRKGCDLEHEILPKNNQEITITYAGNLLYGRANTLERLASAIRKINAQSTGRKFFLKIFSPTIIEGEQKKALSIEGVSEFCGARPYEEVKRILEASDLILHVESFEPKQQEVVKYSFSTKITDALQSGGVLFAIGPKGLSSIEMTRDIPGTIVVNETDEIEQALRNILIMNLYKEAVKIREYAKEHYEIKEIRKRLEQDLKDLCNIDIN